MGTLEATVWLELFHDILVLWGYKAFILLLCTQPPQESSLRDMLGAAWLANHDSCPIASDRRVSSVSYKL